MHWNRVTMQIIGCYIICLDKNVISSDDNHDDEDKDDDEDDDGGGMKRIY